jgi:hypothetical protein
MSRPKISEEAWFGVEDVLYLVDDDVRKTGPTHVRFVGPWLAVERDGRVDVLPHHLVVEVQGVEPRTGRVIT